MKKIEIIEEAVKRGFNYNPETGVITGIRGKEITKLSKKYISIQLTIDGKKRWAYGHQLAFYIVYGYIPKITDHINRDRSDNRICNLREVTWAQNSYNREAKGICWHKTKQKWEARLKINGKYKSLGLYENKDDARSAYLKEKSKYI